MRSERLEAWVLSIVDRVLGGHPVEDSRVELKADWPKPKMAARRIAGHANSAAADSILWIVGLDETKGITSMTPTDLSTWWPQVASEFDGIAPAVMDLAVPTSDKTVLALLFDVTRRPFVVKNPAFGTKNGGAVSLEVPWRSGTAIRSSRRDELLRILVPRQDLPSVEQLNASAEVNEHAGIDGFHGALSTPIQSSRHLAWSFHLTIYVTPHTKELLVLPTHKGSLIFRLGSEETRKADEFRFFAPYRTMGPVNSVLDSSTVNASAGEAVLTGPGMLHARASYYEPVRKLPSDTNLSVTLAVAPAGNDLTTETVFELVPGGAEGDYKRRWKSTTPLIL